MPRSSIARQKRAWASVSQAVAAAKSVTGTGLKKSVTSPGAAASSGGSAAARWR